MPKNVGEVEYAAGVVLAGKYRVDRRLGGGAMGTVYEVTQTDLERTCAVKVMKTSLARDPALLARFRAEAQTHSLLEGSGHICTVFDYGSLEDGTPYYAMTLLRGRPLSELIHYYYAIKQRRFPPKIALAIAHQICKALAFAHERGVVHCDIKPENLFVHVQPGSQAWWVLVVDFGIAHNVASTVQPDEMFIGTPPFSPREQVLGRPPSPKMDVHALGVVLFIMLTGRAPFAHLGAKGLAAVLSARPPAAPLLSQFGDYPRELTALLARCLSHNADERPDARHLAARFHELANELPESGARPDESAKTPALTAPITPSETPLAISRWQQDQDKWDRTQRRLQRRENLRRFARRTGLTLAIVFGVAGASSTGILLFRKPDAPPPHASGQSAPIVPTSAPLAPPPIAPAPTAPAKTAPPQATTAEPAPSEKAPAEPIPAASASQRPSPKASAAQRSSADMAPPPRTRTPQKESATPGNLGTDLETTID
ncbi:protein kinase [Pendulispora brunnea]|uniref:Protein kinase n=1 Tax=Pendulispora brunnea TaxID=2905690 RepID=A0ABZ2K716_9BACT